MIITVSIEPIDKKVREQTLPCVYQFNGKRRMLLDDDTYVDLDLMPNKDKPWPHERILQSSKRGSVVLTYKYESDPKLQNNLDKRKEEAVKIFWGQHPMVTVNGQVVKNKVGQIITTAPMFNMINEIDKSIEQIKSWRDKLAICRCIDEMSYNEKVNCFHYYGQNPKNKTENDLVLKLAKFATVEDPTEGICLHPVEIENFKRIFLNKESSDKDVIINARKALFLGIIQERSTEGRNSYYLGETLMGTAFMDIVSYCKREEKVYNDYILRQINDKEDFSAEKKQSEVKVPDTKLTDIDALRAEARVLKEGGFLWKGLNIEDATFEVLTKHVGQGNEKKEAKKSAVVA